MRTTTLAILLALASQATAQPADRPISELGQVLNTLEDRVRRLEAASEPDQWYVTPEAFGGHRDDNTDDTEALKTCFAFEHGLVVVIVGRYQTTETLYTGQRVGIGVLGGGGTTHPHVPQMDASTGVIEWHGEEGGVMWRYRGSGGWIHGLTLDGRGVAATGFLSDTGPGLNPTKLHASQVAVHRCTDAAWQFGTSAKQHGNDTFSGSGMLMKDCGVAYRLVSLQAVGHHLEKITSKCRVVFDIEAGGRFSCDGLDAPNHDLELVLRTGAGPIGADNGSIRLRNVDIDKGARAAKVWIMTRSVGPDVLIDGMQVSGGIQSRPAFELRPWAKLTVRNARGLVAPGIVSLAGVGRHGVDMQFARCEVPAGVTARDMLASVNGSTPDEAVAALRQRLEDADEGDRPDIVDRWAAGHPFTLDLVDSFSWNAIRMPDSVVSGATLVVEASQNAND